MPSFALAFAVDNLESTAWTVRGSVLVNAAPLLLQGKYWMDYIGRHAQPPFPYKEIKEIQEQNNQKVCKFCEKVIIDVFL